MWDDLRVTSEKRLTCGECGKVSDERASRWVAYPFSEDEDQQLPPTNILIVCPACWEREFSPEVPRSRRRR